MTRKTTVALFYLGVVLLSAAILWLAFFLRSGLPKPSRPPQSPGLVTDAGRETPQEWFEIRRDLEAVNQDGRRVRLSDLKGKVWIAAEFFAVCPHCAVRNGEELHKLYAEFGKHPDFHIVCITVDPEQDDQEKLAAYGKALNADSKNWWFLNSGDQAATHDYLEKELKFFDVRERTDPVDIETNGRFAHDLGFLLVDRQFRVLGKWPLADARSSEARERDPGLYDRLKTEMFARIRAELDSSPTRPAQP